MDPKEDLWRQGLSQGRVMRCTARGGSMLPLLQEGDVVHIVPMQECRIGDIVLARQVLHRVVAKRHGQVITKGDATGRLDAPVTREQILGRAVLRERGSRVRRLDRLGARFLGLAWCLSFPWIPGLVTFLAAARRVLRNLDGLSTLARRPPVVL